MKRLHWNAVAVWLCLCAGALAQSDVNKTSLFGQNTIEGYLRPTSADTVVPQSLDYPRGDWANHKLYEHYTWCAAFTVAEINYKNSHGTPSKDTQLPAKLETAGARVLAADRNISVQQAVNLMSSPIEALLNLLQTGEVFKTSFADGFHSNCVKLSTWVPAPPILGLAAYAKALPPTGEDGLMSSIQGSMAKWNGRPSFQAYGWCSAFLDLEAPHAGPRTREASDNLFTLAQNILVRNRNISAEAAKSLLLPPLANLKLELTSSGATSGLDAITATAGCLGMESREMEAEADRTRVKPAPVPDYAAVALKVPPTASDTRIAATETGSLAPWKGHALYEPYAWCANFMRQAVEGYGPDTPYMKMQNHAAKLVARDRQIPVKDANLIVIPGIWGVRTGVGGDEITQGPGAKAYYDGCAEIEKMAAADELKTAQP